MTENTVHTPKTFSLEIEKIAFDKRCTHLDAISIYCEKTIKFLYGFKRTNRKITKKN